MNQRRMPSGQGPARGVARSSTARARPTGRNAVGEPGQPRTGLRHGGEPARRTRARRGPIRISGRVAALGVVLLVLMLSYAYPLRLYLAQQAEISRLESSQRAERQNIQNLADQVARWNDDNYVKDQALQRLQLVEVGQQVYVVGVDPATADNGRKAAPPPWYQQVWTSVQTADDPPAP